MPSYTFTLLFLVSFCSENKGEPPIEKAGFSITTAAIEEKYPQGDFMFPIEPGKTASLSGSFGDIRFNHFHAGLDIRTGGVEGKPVYAAADGYVSRIGVSGGGYGNALYLTHPNGYTTVYGHLKEYSDKIKSVLIARQYELKSWSLDVNYDPGIIKVKKGEIVAFSGNTGGSGGPHLHFEIRNAAEDTIDPALFGFNEVKDNVQPVIERMVLKTLSADARINGQFGEITVTPTRLKNGNYVINNRISATGKIGVQLYAYDRSQTSPFRLGVTKIDMSVNGQKSYAFRLDKMAFSTKRDMNLHADYEKMVENGQKYHKLFVEEGNRMNLYQTNASAGEIKVVNGKYDFGISVEDTYGNASKLAFNVMGEEQSSVPVQEATATYMPKILVDQFDSFLRIQAVGSTLATEKAILKYKGVASSINPAYKTANSTVYVYDLRDGLVDFVQIGDTFIDIELNTAVSPADKTTKGTAYHVDFGNSLYHPIFLNFTETGNVLNLDRDRFPFKDKFEAKWRFSSTYSDKYAVYLNPKRPKYVGGVWQKNIISFSAKELGSYILLEDRTPPTITPRRINSKDLQFIINDNLSGIKNISCFVNGEWVLMEYEPKLNLLWSEKRDENQPFTGKLLLKVTDNADNEAIYEKTL